LGGDVSLPIGSVGKAILGWVFLRVAHAQALSLDTPVAQVLSIIGGLDGITLRMLGEHRSGLAEPIASNAFQQAIVANPKRQWTFKEVLQVALDQPRQNAPGERFAYSNANSTLLALVLEELSGQPLQVLVQQTLEAAGCPLPSLRCPANLVWRSSGIRAFRHAKPDWPIGYGKTFTDVSAFNPSWSGAGGDWSLNIHDLLKAARLLGASAAERLPGLPPARRHSQDYDFHWQRHGDLQGHLGDVPGFSAALLYEPKTQTAFAAITNLSNASDGSNPAYRLLNAWREGAALTKE
jgi:D-alanyl-D-alanine carboxypeptidase